MGMSERRTRGSCGRQNRVVLAPVAGVKLMEIVGPDRAFGQSSIHRRRRPEGIRLRGERGISRKTTAQGRPGVPAHLRSAVCILAHDCGCHGHPAFPAPSVFGRANADRITSGATRREIALSYPAAGHIQRKQRYAHRSTDFAHPSAPVCDAVPLFAARAD